MKTRHSPPPDLEELAAVAADGRPFDWTGAPDHRIATDLEKLWGLVQGHARAHTQRVGAPRAHLSWWIQGLVWLGTTKALAALAAGRGPAAGGGPLAIQWVLLLVFLLCGLALLYGGVRDARARHLGALLLLVGNGFSNPLLLQAAGSAAASVTMGLLLMRALCVEAFSPAVLWLFVRDFPAAPRTPQTERLFRSAIGMATTAGILLAVANLVAFVIPPSEGTTLSAVVTAVDRNSSGTSFFWLIVFFMAAPALVMMRRRVGAADAQERERVRWFVLALSAGLLPSLLVMLLANRASPLRPLLVANFWLVGVMMYGGLLLVPVVTSYAVLVARVMRVELVLRNGLHYALAHTTLRVAAAAPLIALAVTLYGQRQRTIADAITEPASLVFIALTVAFVLLDQVRRRVLARVDRLFFRDARPLDVVLGRFGEDGAQSVGLAGLAQAVAEAADAGLHPERVFVLVTERAQGRLVPVGAPIRPLATRSVLVEALERARDPVTPNLEEPTGVGRLLPHGDQEWLADAAASVVVPLFGTGGSLVGLIGAGPKLSTMPYSAADRAFLGALAAAAGPAVEARLLIGATGAEAGPPSVNWIDEPAYECRVCGAVLKDAIELACGCGGEAVPMLLPRVLHGKFALDRRLGAGGMGVVYQGVDLALGRRVAVKTLPRIGPEAAHRLRQEARAMAAVSHPHLAVIYGAETWRSTPLLIVELLEGGSLADRLRGGPLPAREVVALGCAVAGALARLHEAGILHRDVKPSNVGFAADGTPKLLDFGLARLVEDGLPPTPSGGASSVGELASSSTTTAWTTRLAGTPLFLSPEAVAGQAPDVSFDLWALAVTLVEALAGRHPWADLPIEVLLERIERDGAPDVSLALGAVPEDLRGCLLAALSRDPARRPATAVEFEGRLRSLGTV